MFQHPFIDLEKAAEAVYKKVIIPACEDAGWQTLDPVQLKTLFHNPQFLMDHLFKSDAVIADLTHYNHDVYYALGVAHTISNKTLMISEKGNSIPFDISNYPIIFYEMTEKGLKDLHGAIVERFEDFDSWSTSPSNPVQEYKLYDPFILKSQLDEEMQAKDREISDYQGKIKEVRTKLAEIKAEVSFIREKVEFIRALRKEKVKKNNIL